MSANVLITKLQNQGQFIYYHVNPVDYPEYIFYISIDPNKKKIGFYKDKSFSHLLGEMDLSDPYKPYNEIPGIDFNISKRVAFQVSKALRDNCLDEDLSYISH